MNMIGGVFVGGAAKEFKIFGYSQAPTISAKIADWSKPGPIHFHPPYAARKPRLTRKITPAPDTTVNFVIETIPEVGRSAMGVVGAPTSVNLLIKIGLIITIGVLHKEHIRSLGQNQSTINPTHPSDKTKSFCESGE